MTEHRPTRTAATATRRRALATAGTGIVASAGVLFRHGGPIEAQAPAPEPMARIGHLFILAGNEGSLLPAADGLFDLTLQDVRQQVIYFTDPPDQRSDFVEVDAMIAQIRLDVAHCNAGLTVATPEHGNEALALELRSADYDPATASATFAVHLLNGFHPTSWMNGFHAATLVIDDMIDLSAL
jgi:hypothetical protein